MSKLKDIVDLPFPEREIDSLDEYIIKDVYVLKSKDGLGYIKDGSNYTNDIMLAKTFSVKSNIKQFLRNYAFPCNNHILLKAKTHYKVELDDNLIVESLGVEII